jgi:hypothetical protein
VEYIDIAGVVESWWNKHLEQPDNNECEECASFASEVCGNCWECDHSNCGGECDECEGRTEECPNITWDFPVLTVVTAVDHGLICLVWQATDDDGDSLESAGWEASDIVAASVTEFAQDLADFWHGNHPDLQGLNPEQVGHDFVLTRNGHGAGFWDRGLGELGDRLTAMCRPYGTFDLYVGDDGKLYSHS